MAYINKINVDGVEYAIQGSEEIYVGTGTPPEGTKIWINPNGDATLPIPAATDVGKFLKATANGTYELASMANAEGVSF